MDSESYIQGRRDGFDVGYDAARTLTVQEWQQKQEKVARTLFSRFDEYATEMGDTWEERDFAHPAYFRQAEAAMRALGLKIEGE